MHSVINLVGLLFLFLLSIKVVQWIQSQRKFRKLINKIPGPPCLPIIGNFNEFFGSEESVWAWLRSMSKKYYPIYKIWAFHEPGVMLISPEDAEVLISSTKNLEKGDFYNSLQEWLGTGLLTSTGSKWHSRRKVLTPAFHFSILKQFLVTFNEQSDLLVDRLETECNKPHINLEVHISKFTLDTICETAMGITPKTLENNQENYTAAISRMGRFVVYRVIRPWMYSDIMFFFTKTFWDQRKLAKALHVYSLNVIRKRKVEHKVMSNGNGSSNKPRLAMLDLLLSAQKSESSIDDEGIREEVDTFMFEGHDTTSLSICYTLMLLACHPEIQENVREEVSRVIKDSEGYTYENLQELKYLEMVIKESLRMFPSVPLISRMTSEDMVTHSGYHIPSDTNVVILIYDIHHNPKLYPDPYKFIPERFLPENCKDRHPYAYIPFSAGPRNCIGQKFAMLELKMVIAKIIRRFLLLPVDTPETITIRTDLLMRTTNDTIRIKLKRRTA